MSEKENFIQSVIPALTVTIPNGQTKTASIDLTGATLKSMILPAAFTGTEISFEISEDDTNFFPYYNIDNNLVKVTCTQGRAYGFAAIDFFSIQFLKLVSNASEGADRDIELILRGL